MLGLMVGIQVTDKDGRSVSRYHVHRDFTQLLHVILICRVI